MGKKLLIDAAHPEILRVATVDDGKIVGFDFESDARKRLIGNIYLARAVRIEAALQAVFVDYGGNRHGFLPFSEIHMDYYKIPVADQTESDSATSDSSKSIDSNLDTIDLGIDDDGVSLDNISELDMNASIKNQAKNNDSNKSNKVHDSEESEQHLETFEQSSLTTKKQVKKYRIQEVIRKDQIFLVQVVRNERGNKGAALTTYISLAGRYCVLMPNSGRGGGISRKITSINDRRKLKKIAADISVPKDAGLIIRTAGISRTKQEIRRDYDFLARQWDQIRETTLKSIAPTKIHEEGDLIRRTIRDDYSRDMDEVLVEGDDGYKAAKRFMKLIMPSHAKKVKQHSETMPIFNKYGIEDEIGSFFNSKVQLKSGGYIVIDRTEALIAIDVNSGRSIREGTLEKTALQTNLEASETIATQLRLRDLAGLIVVDFIDMDDQKNNLLVEKKLKDCVKSDRSRIQLGRISSFGLLELSRQRMKAGIYEIATQECPHCKGSGRIRSDHSLIIDILRQIQILAAAKDDLNVIEARVPIRLANLLLNHKRLEIQEIEKQSELSIVISGDYALQEQDVELRKLKVSDIVPQDLQEQVIRIEHPFRQQEIETRYSNQRSDGSRRKRRRGSSQAMTKMQNQEDLQNKESSSLEKETKKKSNKSRGRKFRRKSNRPISNIDTNDTAQSSESQKLQEQNIQHDNRPPPLNRHQGRRHGRKNKSEDSQVAELANNDNKKAKVSSSNESIKGKKILKAKKTAKGSASNQQSRKISNKDSNKHKPKQTLQSEPKLNVITPDTQN